MDASQWAVGFALLVGSVRAVELWRSAPRVDVVNVVVLGALAEGRGSDLDLLLRSIGSAPYFHLVRSVVRSFSEHAAEDDRTLRKNLERETLVALALANRAIRRFAWLDALALVAIVFAGASAALSARATPVVALELLAATLLWLANVRGARSIATRMYAGATALGDGLVKSRDLGRG